MGGSKKPSKDRGAERRMREQERREKQRLAEEESELAKKKYVASTQGLGFKGLLTNTGGLKGQSSKSKKLSGNNA